MQREDLDLRLQGNVRRVVQDPPVIAALFGGTRFTWLWLAARVYLGWELLSAGRQKLQDPMWMESGTALQQVWQEAARSAADGSAATGWHRELLQFLIAQEWHGWIAPGIAVGETLIGIAVILGLFTGIAAFGGGLMAFTAVLAGSTTANPLLFTIAVLLVLAWKTGGWIGLDRWVLPLASRPWRFRRTSIPSEVGIDETHPVKVTG